MKKAREPKILTRLKRQLRDRGESHAAADRHARTYLVRSGNLKPGGQTATAKGIRRGNMTAKQRAASRARAYRRR